MKTFITSLILLFALSFIKAQSIKEFVLIDGITNVKPAESYIKHSHLVFRLSKDSDGKFIPLDSILIIKYDNGKMLYCINQEKIDNPKTISIKEAKKMQKNNDLKGLMESRIVCSDIQFEIGSAKISEDELSKLDDMVSFMDNWENVKLKIVGHTSADGSDKYNMKLSLKRAESVVKYLIANGIEKERLSFEGKGENMLLPAIDPNDSLNRRVELLMNYQERAGMQLYTNESLKAGSQIIKNEKISFGQTFPHIDTQRIVKPKKDSIEINPDDSIWGLFKVNRPRYSYLGLGIGLLKNARYFADISTEAFNLETRIPMPIFVTWEKSSVGGRFFHTDWWTTGGFVNFTMLKIQNDPDQDLIPSLGIGWRNNLLISEIIDDLVGIKKHKRVIPQNLEFYAGFHVGVQLNFAKNNTNSSYSPYTGGWFVHSYLGTRYFFKNFGVSVEIGDANQSLISTGVVFRWSKDKIK